MEPGYRHLSSVTRHNRACNPSSTDLRHAVIIAKNAKALLVEAIMLTTTRIDAVIVLRVLHGTQQWPEDFSD